MTDLIITTANIEESYEDRKLEYMDSLMTIYKGYRQYFKSIYIVETYSAYEEYLNNFGDVFYIKSSVENKGISEFFNIGLFLKKIPIEDFIKISGRYKILDNSLLRRDKTGLDFMGKLDDDMYVGDGVHTFYFYMMRKLLEDFVRHLPVIDVPVEQILKTYLESTNCKYELINKLGIYAKPFYNQHLAREV